ncbi:UDP-2,4-diacetamido-2,4,6-trideoxy-beta-L-altropyranose hydrolase [Desulfitobacterium sp. Sab5]|uniref:UDP-2,4-diacetamido-2,4, 6-trideoxy-beta-L-altropyranose hydrolase n=1 Tax=Desulfitobacterium nosdiversum TaxID=3375356 RepID=UPI003CEE2A12
MIGIRVDVNETIATGHFMRCLSIAQGIRNSNIDVLFISADSRTSKLAEYYQFQAIQLNTIWDDMISEVDILTKIICKYRINKLVVDSYYVTEEYFRKLSEYVKLIYIDDINKFNYPVDVLINYNAYFNLFNYSQTYKETNTKLILGPKYAPLRNEFRGINYKANEIVQNILITTGGADTYEVAVHLAKAIIKDDRLSQINIHIIAGRYSKITEKVDLKLYSNIRIHKNVKNMSDLMKQCDIAVAAGGSTLYELCACGVPSVSFIFADNQAFGAKAFDDMNLIPFSGDVRNGMDKCLEKIISNIQYYITNYEIRKQKSRAMQLLVDGFGVDRIVKDVFCL